MQRRKSGQSHTESACQSCGRSFIHPIRRQARYCSKPCADAGKRGKETQVERLTCTVCGAEFRDHVSQVRKYCSKPCQYKAMSQRKTRPESRVTTTCPTCGTEFEYYLSWPRKYCSNVCAGKANVTNIPTFAPFDRFTTPCEWCSTPFEVRNSSYRGRFCSRRCVRSWQASDRSSDRRDTFWVGGRLDYGPSFPAARRAVRKRDSVCQDCGAPPGFGRGLDVHHRVPFKRFGVERHEEANQLDNLIGLCRPCHAKREWSPFRRVIPV